MRGRRRLTRIPNLQFYAYFASPYRVHPLFLFPRVQQVLDSVRDHVSHPLFTLHSRHVPDPLFPSSSRFSHLSISI